MKIALPSKAIPLIYVVDCAAQRAKHKQLFTIVASIADEMIPIVKASIPICASPVVIEKHLKSVRKMLTVWAKRGVFPRSLLDAAAGMLDEHEAAMSNPNASEELGGSGEVGCLSRS